MTRNLSMSKEDYLEAIYVLEKKEAAIRSVRIAEMLNVSKPAVNKAMHELATENLIIKDNYSAVTLTEEGRKLARMIYGRHLTIKEFLLKIGVSEKTAELDCCKIEHIVSKETIGQIRKFNKEH